MITLNIHIHNIHCGKFTQELEEDPEAPEGISKNIQYIMIVFVVYWAVWGRILFVL